MSTLKPWQRDALLLLDQHATARTTSATTHETSHGLVLNWRTAQVFERHGLATVAAGVASITDAGRAEAARLRRAGAPS